MARGQEALLQSHLKIVLLRNVPVNIFIPRATNSFRTNCKPITIKLIFFKCLCALKLYFAKMVYDSFKSTFQESGQRAVLTELF